LNLPILLSLLVHNQVVHPQLHQNLLNFAEVARLCKHICLRQLIHHLLVADAELAEIDRDRAHRHTTVLVFDLDVDAAIRCRVNHLMLLEELGLLPHRVHVLHLVVLLHVVALVHLLRSHLLHLALIELLVVVGLRWLLVTKTACHWHDVYGLLLALAHTLLIAIVATEVIGAAELLSLVRSIVVAVIAWSACTTCACVA
jgi:hypothetical protein